MQSRGRLFLIIGLVLLLLFGGGFLLITLGGGLLGTIIALAIGAPPPTQGGDPTTVEVQPVNTVQVAIALQNIDIGTEVTTSMVSGPAAIIGLIEFPVDRVPPTALVFDGVEKTLENTFVEQRARYDIQQGEILLRTSFVDKLYETSRTGSTIAEQIPPGLVGIAIPMTRILSLNNLIEPGDHVNVLVAFTVVDVDEQFQSVLPNISVPISLVNIANPESEPIELNGGEPVGRLDAVSAAPFAFLSGPSEPQRPRLVTQQIIQNALVLAVGTTSPFDPPTPTPLPEQQSDEPLPTPAPPDALLLAVSPEDSLAINYFMFSRGRFTLTLRGVGDTSLVNTASVSLEDIIQRYVIEIPLPLTFSTDPAIRFLRPPQLTNDITELSVTQEPVFVEAPNGNFFCLGEGCSGFSGR